METPMFVFDHTTGRLFVVRPEAPSEDDALAAVLTETDQESVALGTPAPTG